MEFAKRKLINRSVYYFIQAEAQATISGPEFVRTSSTISLTCSVNIHSQPAGSVTWYHGQSVVDFNSPRGGISMETTKSEQGTVSKLVITKATSADGILTKLIRYAYLRTI